MSIITAHLGRQEMKVWHFPEQDCDIVICHFSRLYYTKILWIIIQNGGRFSRFLGFFQGISPKNGHPSFRLGFGSSHVEARRGWHTLIYVYTPYMTVYITKSLPRIMPFVHRIYLGSGWT